MLAAACALVESNRDPRRVMERGVAAGLPARAREGVLGSARRRTQVMSFILMTDSRVFLTLVRIFSYSISSSVFP